MGFFSLILTHTDHAEKLRSNQPVERYEPEIAGHRGPPLDIWLTLVPFLNPKFATIPAENSCELRVCGTSRLLKNADEREGCEIFECRVERRRIFRAL